MNTSELRPALVVAVLALTSCSGPVTTDAISTKEPEKTESSAPAVPVTAKTAFWEMYKAAHAWAPDMLPLTIEAKTMSGFTFEGGKAAMWKATFGSPAKKQYATFTYSIADRAPDIHKGVVAAGAVPWAGPTQEALSFQSSELVVDSDEAYKTALTKAGAWIKEHPAVPLNTVSVGAASRFPGPVWYFLWGDKKLGFFQLVSASTGAALK